MGHDMNLSDKKIRIRIKNFNYIKHLIDFHNFEAHFYA